MDSPATISFLDMDDYLLCEVFKSLSTYDKRQHVQRTCLRFRDVLQRPSVPGSWGCVTVRLLRRTDASPDSVRRLIKWLVDRKIGITMVTLITEHIRINECYPRQRAVTEQTVLHVLAIVLAAEGMPLRYAGHVPETDDLVTSSPLSFAMMDAEVVAALQKSVRLLAIRCSDFRPHYWDILCSLHRIQSMTLCLQTSYRPYAAAYDIRGMRLFSLRQLDFVQCSVPLQPMLHHLSALTNLTKLSFHQCPEESWSAVSGAMPPIHSLIHLTFHACNLSSLPSLAQLLHLETLTLDDNPELRDVQRGLSGLTSLTKMSMQARTPISEGTLGAVKQLPALRTFDVRGHKWTPARNVGRLQRRVREWNVRMIM